MNGEPAFVQRKLRGLVPWRKHLLEMLARLTCQGVYVKPRPGPSGMTILFAAFCMSCWSHTHLRSDTRQVCTSLVNSAIVSFVVESECDVLRV